MTGLVVMLLVLSFSSSKPYFAMVNWQLRVSIHLMALGREVSREWRDNLSRERSLLRQLWGVQRKVSGMPEKFYLGSKLENFQLATPENDERVSWMKTNEEVRFKSSRRGNMLSSPFQCDHCWFVNMKKKVADDPALGDMRLLAIIRWINLDIMWSSEPSVVKAALKNLEKKGKNILLNLVSLQSTYLLALGLLQTLAVFK